MLHFENGNKGKGNKNFLESISLWVDKSISSLHFLSLESRSALPGRQLNWLNCFAYARNDGGHHPETTRAQALRRSRIRLVRVRGFGILKI